MASPLTKCEVVTGKAMTRPIDVEREIDQVLLEGPARVRERLAIALPAQPGYLRSESLVYLIRAALRRGESGEEYFFVLNARCDAILEARLSADLPDVEELRQDILTDLATSLVDDVRTGGNAMDFFECKFHLAFRTMRLDHLDQHLRRHRRSVELAPPDIDRDEEKALPDDTEPSFAPATVDPELNVYLKEILAFVRANLPVEVQRAFFLVRVHKWKRKRVAALLGVTEKTIFNWLKAADEKLASVKEDA